MTARWEPIFVEKVVHEEGCPFVLGDEDRLVECECYVVDLWDAIVELEGAIRSSDGYLTLTTRAVEPTHGRSRILRFSRRKANTQRKERSMEKRVVRITAVLSSPDPITDAELEQIAQTAIDETYLDIEECEIAVVWKPARAAVPSENQETA